MWPAYLGGVESGLCAAALARAAHNFNKFRPLPRYPFLSRPQVLLVTLTFELLVAILCATCYLDPVLLPATS